MHDSPKECLKITPRIQQRLDRDAQQRALVASLRRACVVGEGRESVFYIVRHKGALPWSVMADMAQMGIGVFCPVEKVQQRVGRLRRVQIVNDPKYAGYFFVEAPMGSDAAICGILSFDGVACLMGRDGVPRAISLEAMENIRKPVHVKRAALRLLFSVGERICIANGSFESLEGVVVAPANQTGQIRIEVDVLGGLVPVTLGVDSVRKL